MTHADYRTFRCWLAGAAAVLVLAFSAGCGQSVRPGKTHHRLYAWNCPSTKDKRAFLVLRYQDAWKDASKTSRVGLIKFQTQPEPIILQDRYVWGIPTGGEAYVLFDAMTNEVLRRTSYVRQIAVGGEASGCEGLLAFAGRNGGTIELVRPNGRVVVPSNAGYADVKLAFSREDGSAVLALARPDGHWQLMDDEGAVVTGGEALTSLDLSPLPTP